MALLVAGPAAGQESALLQGFVVEEETGRPVASARVTIVAGGADTRTEDDGSFAFSDAPFGRFFVRVEARGYPTVVEEVELAPGDDVFLPVFLTSQAALLDELLVIGSRPEAMAKQGAMTAADLLARQVPGISVFATAGRSTPTGLGLRGRGTFGAGEPVIVLDGARFSGGVGEAMDRMRQISAGDVKSIRLLRGPTSAFLYGAPHGVVYVQTHEGPAAP